MLLEMEHDDEGPLHDRAARLARQIAGIVLACSGATRLTLVRPAPLIHAVSRRLAWYGLVTQIQGTGGPGLLCLTMRHPSSDRVTTGADTRLDHLLADPLIGMVMDSDHVSPTDVRALFSQLGRFANDDARPGRPPCAQIST